MKFYMHTIDGKPGFWGGDQICFASHGHQVVNELAKSLDQIKREQEKTREFRKKSCGYDDARYGYIIVSTPGEEDEH